MTSSLASRAAIRASVRASVRASALSSRVFAAAAAASLAAAHGAVAQTPFVDLTPDPQDAPYRVSVATLPVSIGRYKVTSNVFTSPGCLANAACNPYAPTLWKARQTGAAPLKIRMDLTSELKDEATNFHTHGLVVSVNSAAAGFVGDNVFVSLCGTGASPACAMSAHGHGVPSQGTLKYQFEFPPRAESGLNWFHAHVHGLARAQVTSGMSGLIAIGDPCDTLKGSVAATTYDFLCDATHKLKTDAVTERFLGLRDAQLVRTPANGVDAARHVDQIVPTFCENDARALSARTGECRGSAIADVANGCPDDGGGDGCPWAYTINGASYPTIRFSPSDPKSLTQVWRIANMSADISYRLIIRREAAGVEPVAFDVAANCGDVGSDRCLPFVALNLDGAPATDALLPDQDNLQRELFLMPGSRAEILVRHPGPAKAGIYRLEQIGFQTGGDDWPFVSLARLDFEPGQGSALAFQVTPPLATMAMRVNMPAPAPKKIPADCVGAPTIAARDDHRDVTVGFLVEPDGSFKLATAQTSADAVLPALVGGPGAASMAYMDGFTLKFAPFVAFGQMPDGTMDMSRVNLCVEVARNERPVTFHLLNFSDEVHNFHIHQQKFHVLDVTPAQPLPGSTEPNPDQSAGAYYAGPGQRARHDTAPVPRAILAGDLSPQLGRALNFGRATVRMRFDQDPQQIGKFVYHCHILEHEDGGMMAAIRGY